ncbi:Group 27 mite allergen-like protein (Serpin-like), partial [Euroglyphus maynei]
MRRLATSLNQFGLDLARSMEMQPRFNLSSSYSFSPFCVGTSLAILMAGLEENDHQQQQQQQIRTSEHSNERLYESLRYGLYLNSMQPQEIHLAFLDLMRHLQVNMPVGFSLSSTEMFDQLDHRDRGIAEDVMFTVNQVYVQRYIPMDYRFYRLVQRYYQTPIRSLDFAYAPEESWHHINAKVEHETQGRIDRVLDSHSQVNASHHPLSSTRLLFLSGLHFRARLDFRHLVTHNRRRRRGALQRLWPLRSPFLPNHHHPIMLPALVHSNHHRPPVNRPPFGLLFKPWLANQTLNHLHTPSMMMATTSTTTTTTTTSTSMPVINTKLSTTTAAPILVSKPNSGHVEHAATFNPFEPYRPLLAQNGGDENDRVAIKERIRLRYQHNDYLNSTVIELPFVGGTVSMLILLPDSVEQMSLMLSRLNGQLIIDLLQSLETRRMDISLPLFTNQSHFIAPDRLDHLLGSIGLGDLFNAESNDEHRVANVDQKSLAALVPMMSIYHKCMIDIDVIDDDDDDQQQQQQQQNDWPAQDNMIASS